MNKTKHLPQLIGVDETPNYLSIHINLTNFFSSLFFSQTSYPAAAAKKYKFFLKIITAPLLVLTEWKTSIPMEIAEENLFLFIRFISLVKYYFIDWFFWGFLSASLSFIIQAQFVTIPLEVYLFCLKATEIIQNSFVELWFDDFS